MRKAPVTVQPTKAVAILGLGLASVLLAACAAAGPSNGAGASEHPFESILSASQTAVTERRREVIRDEASWARLWAEIHADVTPAPPLPSVDFSQHMLIAVALGTRPSGGFGIKVRSVASRGESLEVAVLEVCPAPGSVVTLALTAPVEVVRAPRLAQTPTFRETRAASCR